MCFFDQYFKLFWFGIQDSRITQGDSAKLTKTKDVLLEKLADFEATNRTLRRLLREQHKQEAASVRLSEQRDVLIKRLADTDISNEVKLSRLDNIIVLNSSEIKPFYDVSYSRT